MYLFKVSYRTLGCLKLSTRYAEEDDFGAVESNEYIFISFNKLHSVVGLVCSFIMRNVCVQIIEYLLEDN